MLVLRRISVIKAGRLKHPHPRQSVLTSISINLGCSLCLWRLASIGQRLYITRVSFPLQINGHRGVLPPSNMVAMLMLRGLALNVCTRFSYHFCAKISLAYLDFTADMLGCVSKIQIYIEFRLTFLLRRSLRILLQSVVASRPQP